MSRLSGQCAIYGIEGSNTKTEHMDSRGPISSLMHLQSQGEISTVGACKQEQTYCIAIAICQLMNWGDSNSTLKWIQCWHFKSGRHGQV